MLPARYRSSLFLSSAAHRTPQTADAEMLWGWPIPDPDCVGLCRQDGAIDGVRGISNGAIRLAPKTSHTSAEPSPSAMTPQVHALPAVPVPNGPVTRAIRRGTCPVYRLGEYEFHSGAKQLCPLGCSSIRLLSQESPYPNTASRHELDRPPTMIPSRPRFPPHAYAKFVCVSCSKCSAVQCSVHGSLLLSPCLLCTLPQRIRPGRRDPQ